MHTSVFVALLAASLALSAAAVVVCDAPAAIAARQASTRSSPVSSPAVTTETVPISASVITTAAYGEGVLTGGFRLQATFPLPCLDGCYDSAAPYGYCFGNFIYRNGTSANPLSESECNSRCNQTQYDRLTACLNCIVANGNERPYGNTTATNTASTAAIATMPIGLPDDLADSIPYNGNGFIDAEQANGLLANVTEACAARGVSLEGEPSVTAVPTTTGPYSASWSSGQTIDRPTWTGLTQYPPATQTLTLFRGTPPASSVGGTASQNAEGTSTRTQAPAAAGTSSQAAGHGRLSAGTAKIPGALGFVLALALLQ